MSTASEKIVLSGDPVGSWTSRSKRAAPSESRSENHRRNNVPWRSTARVATTPPSGGTRLNEAGRTDLSADEVRFTTKGDMLYAFVMGWPDKKVLIRPLAPTNKFLPPKVSMSNGWVAKTR